MSGQDVNDLREEIHRLLADALRTADETRAETARLQLVHDDELAALKREHDDLLAALGATHGAEVDQLQAALATRDVIGQAKGILMAAMRCTADEAFALLVKQSQAENRKLIDIAHELAARASQPARAGEAEPSRPAG
jgi:hypothetical protein